MSRSTSKRTLYLDSDPSAYQAFMSTEDATRIAAMALGTRLEQATSDLVFAWRKASDARALPWVLAHSVPAMTTRSHPLGVLERPTLAEDLLKGILGRLRLTGVTFVPRRVRRGLKEAILKATAELREARAALNAMPVTEAEVKWAFNGLLGDKTFVSAVVAHESQAYAAIFFGYEDFLSSAVADASSTGEYPATANNLKAGLKEEFGTDLLDRCWSDRRIRAAAEARHAIVHRGGRSNHRTEKYSDLLDLRENEDGIREVVIRASATNALYRLLYGRVLRVLQSPRVASTQPATA